MNHINYRFCFWLLSQGGVDATKFRLVCHVLAGWVRRGRVATPMRFICGLQWRVCGGGMQQNLVPLVCRVSPAVGDTGANPGSQGLRGGSSKPRIFIKVPVLEELLGRMGAMTLRL